MKTQELNFKNEAAEIKENNNNFFFPAKKVPSVSLLPNMAFNAYNNHAVVVELFNEETNSTIEKVVNFCSEGYALIHNSEIFSPIEEILRKDLNLEFEVVRKVSLDSQFYVDYIFSNLFFQIGKNKSDILTPAFKIQHSYNGKLSYTIYFGFYSQLRDVTYWGSSNQLSFSHSVGNTDLIINGTIEAIEEYFSSFEENKEKFLSLQKSKIVNPEAMIEDVVEKSNFYKQQDFILDTLNYELKEYKTGMNYWALYNAFVAVLQSENSNKSQDKERVSKDKNVFNVLLNY